MLVLSSGLRAVIMASVRPLVLALVLGLVACGSESATPPNDEEQPPPEGCDAWQIAAADGTCCEPGTVPAAERGCRSAGVPEGACVEGFVWEDGACLPVLPVDVCPPGEMAVPGEDACRPIVPCEGGPYGATPDEPTTQYVDASHTGGLENGTMEQPWTTINDAIAAAQPGAAIGVAPGTYPEDLFVDRAVRIYGRCPTEVTIAGVAATWTVAIYGSGADGTELHNLGVMGPVYDAVAVTDAVGVLLHRVWLHDAADSGLLAGSDVAATEVSLVDSAITDAAGYGVFVTDGANVAVTRSHVHDVGNATELLYGAYVQGEADLAITSSLIERVGVVGFGALGPASARIDASVVRNTIAATTPDLPSAALIVIGRDTGEPAVMTAVDTTVDGAPGAATIVEGSDFVGQRLTARHPVADATKVGWGVTGAPGAAMTTSNIALSDSMLDGCTQVGMYLSGSSATFSGSVMRGVRAEQLGLGAGIVVGVSTVTQAPSALTSTDSLFEDLDETAVFVDGSSAELLHTAIEGAGLLGHETAIQVQRDTATGRDAGVLIDQSRVRGARRSGVVLSAATGTLQRSVVEATTSADDGTFGNGITVVSDQVAARLSLLDALVADNDLAGVASFGGIVDLAGTTIRCNDFAIAAEVNFAFEPETVDSGGNTCGCEQEAVCKALSVGLEPPEAVEPVDP